MLEKTLKLMGIGFLLGMAIGDFITIITSLASGSELLFFTDLLLERVGSEALALLVQTVLSGVYGALCWAGIMFDEIESWGLLKAAVLHYLIIVLGFLPFAGYLGWTSFDPVECLTRAGIQALAYAIIFLIMDARYRREVEQLNELLTDAA